MDSAAELRTECGEERMQVQYTVIDPFLATRDFLHGRYLCRRRPLERLWSMSMIYALLRFWFSSTLSICPNPPLVVITMQSIASTMIRKRAYSQAITPLLAPPVQDEDRHPPSSSLSHVIPYVLLSSRVSRCRVSILWISSFRLRMRFHRLRRRS